MPQAFNRCVKQGGRVVTKRLSGGRYIRLCRRPSGKWTRGEVKKAKSRTSKRRRK